MGAEICAHKAQSEEEILSILDAEQTELFLQMREERQFRANDKTRSRKGRDPLDCSGSLSLSCWSAFVYYHLL